MEIHFDEELKDLRQQILKISSLAQEAIYRSIESLKARDKDMAKAVIESDKKIDELELSIDDKCLDLIARRQPVAQDLRFITMAMMITTDLERIADLAVDISQRTIEIADKPLLKPLVDIPKLSVLAQAMVRESIEAFIEKDVEKAKSVILRDSEADNLKNMVQHELVNDYMAKDKTTAGRAVPLLLVARHLERICDHATNICENVIYMVEAKVVKHHFERLDEA